MMKDNPPELLGGARLLQWSPIDHRHTPTGGCRHVVNGETLGPMERLAICQCEGGFGVYLFGCDAAWNTVTDTWHEELRGALDQAEFEYEGVSQTWITVVDDPPAKDLWSPATESEVERIIADQLRRCTDAHQALFETVRVPIQEVAIERQGQIERVFIVARIGDAVVFFDDVEDGFEIAEPDPDGVLRNYGASQYDLSHILHQMRPDGAR